MTADQTIRPVAIGCTGGSGSRMLRDILAASPEIFMDRDCSPNSKDSRGSKVLIRHADPTTPAFAEMALGFMSTILAHIPAEDASRYRWFGWKNPGNIKIIDALMQIDPQLHFLHLVRDPAAPVNSSQPRKSYKRQRANGNPEAHAGRASFVLKKWARVNLPVWKRYRDSPRYRLVRYEEMVTKPRETIESLFEWLGVSSATWRDAVATVHPPPDAVSRCRDVDISLIAEAAAELGYGAPSAVCAPG